VVGVTHANDHSSRSHLIVTVHIKALPRDGGASHLGKLHLVDLAGSERQAKALVQGAEAVESKHINRSLTALQDVFAALLAKEKHVPFRNSKLTQLLQDSLAGNSKVLMIVTVSCRAEDARESISSLSLARRVRSIVLGGAKRAVENAEYARLTRDHALQLHVTPPSPPPRDPRESAAIV
jgi:kinesin family protein C2/C3